METSGICVECLLRLEFLTFLLVSYLLISGLYNARCTLKTDSQIGYSCRSK